MAGFGAIGSLGIQVTEDQLKACLSTNEIAITVPGIFTISLAGQLMESASISDLAFTLLQGLPSQAITNKLIVITGSAVANLTAHERYDLCHFMNEAGAYSSLISAVDENKSDYTLSLNTIQPMMALPGDIHHIDMLTNVGSVKVNEVFIGGCRGGKIEDLRAAAAVVRGEKIAYRVRMIVAPATSETYIQAVQEGLLQEFLDFGAVVMNQGCSVCWGKAQGYLDDNEVLVSTGSYNHAGCSGSPKANVYLVSPIVAAKSAITGVLQS
jgi:3-isopropylmalate/(R)-2-methylmalate dehydratase large subunit